MKRLWRSATAGLASVLLLSGCVAAIGNRDGKPVNSNATVGQQLIDLQKARDAGAMTPGEYEQQKARVLEHK